MARVEPSDAVDDILNLEIARGRSANSKVSRRLTAPGHPTSCTDDREETTNQAAAHGGCDKIWAESRAARAADRLSNNRP
jgi:hypothetical protein